MGKGLIRKANILPVIAGALALPELFRHPEPEVNSWKPEFTSEELERLRALPKRERKAYLEELRQKYLSEERRKKYLATRKI